MVAEHFCSICQVIGIYADAMSTHKSWSEPQCVPFRIHPTNYFICVNPHSVANHRNLIHKCNINISLAVLHYFDGFCCFNCGYWYCPSFDYNVIYFLDLTSRLLIHPRYNLLNAGQSMYTVAGVNTFRAVANLPVNTAFKSRLFFNNRHTDILSHTWINCRFKNYN